MTYSKLANNTSPMVLTDGTGHYKSLVGRNNVVRKGIAAYRLGLTAADRVSPLNDATLADVTTGGSLLANTNYKFAHCPESILENGTGRTNSTTLTTANDGSNTHVMRVTLGQVTNATHYHLFCSTDSNPRYVAKISEAQRAAGCTITAVGTVSATSPGAGIIDIRIAGVLNFSLQNAPFGIGTSRGPNALPSETINCSGYNWLQVIGVYHADDAGAAEQVVQMTIYGLAYDRYFQLATYTQSTSQDSPTNASPVNILGFSSVKIAYSSLTIQPNPNQSVDIYYDLF